MHWYKVICTVLEKDFILGYLLLSLLGRGTVVLSTLMTLLNAAQVISCAATT